jgi:hypothetical protein
MRMSERTKAQLLALALWGFVVCAALATRPFETGFFGPEALESVAVGALLLAFASSRRIRALLVGIGAPRALFVIALLGLSLWGQLARDNRTTFPFLHWSMYTSKAPQSRYVEFEVCYRNGETGLFPFGQFTSFSGSKFLPSRGRTLENRITKWLDPARGARGPDTARAELAKLAATYNARHRDNPLAALSVVRRSVPIHDFAGRASVSREVLLEMRLDD